MRQRQGGNQSPTLKRWLPKYEGLVLGADNKKFRRANLHNAGFLSLENRITAAQKPTAF